MPAAPIRRIGAFAVDYIVLAIYVAGLTAVTFALGGAEGGVSGDPAMKMRFHAIAFLTLTAPVILYFALCEAIWGRTVGKKVCSLKVEALDGRAPGIGRALARNIIKFLPWEIAHTAIWYGSVRPFLDPMESWALATCFVALAAVLLLVASLWLPGGRAIHDRLAGTRVVRV